MRKGLILHGDGQKAELGVKVVMEENSPCHG